MLSRLLADYLNLLSGMSWPVFLQPHVDSFVSWVNRVLEFWDLEYLEYLIWLFLPIFIAFLLPIFLLIFIYGCVIFLHVYALRHRIREAYASSYWDGARTSIASFWDGIGYLWHGYDVCGLENIPDTGPALIVAYHGTLPLDLYYLIAKVILYKKRTIHCVADKFVFKIPGWGKLCKVFCMTPGTVEDCVNNLKKGNLIIIAPGGVREALFSSSTNYQIMWGRRLGFAKVVIGADVPVIPMFTCNSRDAFRTPLWGRRCFRILYERSRLPICPIYGGFPVKMITYLSEPIYFENTSVTPEEIKLVVKKEVASLIKKYQLLPGSILKGIFQRFSTKLFENKTENNDESANKQTKEQRGRRYFPINENKTIYVLKKKSDFKATPLLNVQNSSEEDGENNVLLEKILGDDDDKMIVDKYNGENEENEVGISAI